MIVAALASRIPSPPSQLIGEAPATSGRRGGQMGEEFQFNSPPLAAAGRGATAADPHTRVRGLCGAAVMELQGAGETRFVLDSEKDSSMRDECVRCGSVLQ